MTGWTYKTLGSPPSMMPTNLPDHCTRQAKGRDHEIVRAQKKVSEGRPNTPPTSCSVVTDPRV